MWTLRRGAGDIRDVTEPHTTPAISLAFGAGEAVARLLGAPMQVRGELILPAGGPPPSRLLVCLPGGGMNRRYFDLPTPAGEAEASFARAMVERGFAVVLLDPLGVGESDTPADPYLLTPDTHALALTTVVEGLKAALSSGTLAGAPALPGLRSLGVGHSFGAALTVAVQARTPLHAGLALFGFGVAGAGLRSPLEEAALPLAQVRPRIAEFARRRYPEPYIALPPAGGPRAAMLEAAGDRLLATTAYVAVLPNALAEEAASVRTSVLLAFGDKDMHGPPHAAVASYPASCDVTLLVLAETRHNHFTYPSRTQLFDRLAQWAERL